MGHEYKNVIFTDHALERMKKRHISEKYVVQTIQQPDSREPEEDGKIKFTKTINSRKVQVVGTYLEDDKKWMAVSAWVRGEEDRAPLWQQILALPFKGIRWIFRKIFK